MTEWIDDLAEALGSRSLSKEETSEVLRIAREVAHRVERRLTPLSTFLLGEAVARGTRDGQDRESVLSQAISEVERLLPEDG